MLHGFSISCVFSSFLCQDREKKERLLEEILFLAATMYYKWKLLRYKRNETHWAIHVWCNVVLYNCLSVYSFGRSRPFSIPSESTCCFVDNVSGRRVHLADASHTFQSKHFYSHNKLNMSSMLHAHNEVTLVILQMCRGQWSFQIWQIFTPKGAMRMTSCSKYKFFLGALLELSFLT